MGKCLYCNKDCDTSKSIYTREGEFCSSEHKDKYLNLVNKFNSHKKFFYGGVVASVLIALTGTLLKGFYDPLILLAYVGTTLAGIILFLLPLSTPETAKSIGLKNSVLLVRIVALLITAFGIYEIIKYFV